MLLVDGNAAKNSEPGLLLADPQMGRGIRTYSKGWSMTPEAVFDDGLLDLAAYIYLALTK